MNFLLFFTRERLSPTTPIFLTTDKNIGVVVINTHGDTNKIEGYTDE